MSVIAVLLPHSCTAGTWHAEDTVMQELGLRTRCSAVVLKASMLLYLQCNVPESAMQNLVRGLKL